MPDVSILSSPSKADLLVNSFYMTPGCPWLFSYTDVSITTPCNSNTVLWFRFVSAKNHPLSYGTSTMEYCLLNLNSKLHVSLFILKPTLKFPLALQRQYVIKSKKGYQFFLQMFCLPWGDRIQYCAQGGFENHKHRPHSEVPILNSVFNAWWIECAKWLHPGDQLYFNQYRALTRKLETIANIM